MSSTVSDNKRIAKNTLILYARTLFSLCISLYTSRVILAALGLEDYGLYNVIGSAVTMFIFLKSAMGNSVYRFIMFALGKNDSERLNRVFSMSIMIHSALAFVIVLLCETVGLWFLNTHIEIPSGREIAANWVFQFSTLSCALTVICVPYDAIIVAHEKMGVFAFIQVMNSLLNFVIAFSLEYCNYDRLILFATLRLSIDCMNRIFYGIYCNRTFPELKIHFYKDNLLLKEMTGFAGWSLFGNMAFLFSTQGLNIILNIFFGPLVNAARGVAVQVQGAIKGFVSNFQMALNPQITKSYAKEDFIRLNTLINSSSRLSFCLLWCLVLPVIVEAEAILQLWLKDVPDYAPAFVRIILITMLIDTLENPLATAIAATGRIKVYQIIAGSMKILVLPISYVALYIKDSPEIVFYINFIVFVIAFLACLIFASKILEFSIRKYSKRVILPLITMFVLTSLIAYLVSSIYSSDTFISVLLKCCFYLCTVWIISYYLVLEVNERGFIDQKMRGIFGKLKR
jgi:O-antigen/teichoic acid export membrane protein